MPIREFPAPLDEAGDHELYVVIETSGTPRRLGHFSIQYRCRINGRWHQVVRYDNSHDVPHRHLFDKDGKTIQRDVYAGETDAQVLNRAQSELKRDWRRFCENFRKREGL